MGSNSEIKVGRFYEYAGIQYLVTAKGKYFFSVITTAGDVRKIFYDSDTGSYLTHIGCVTGNIHPAFQEAWDKFKKA